MPADRKEPHYFTHACHEPVSWYEAFFEAARGEKAIGEASTWYMSDNEAPGRIAALLPDVRMIFLLRQPAERAYSHYWYRVARSTHVAATSFSDAIRSNDFDAKAYVGSSLYADHLKRWVEVFGRERVLVLLQDDLNADPQGVLRRIHEYLGVDPSFQADTERRHNVTYYPKNMRLFRAVIGLYEPVERLMEGGPLRRAWSGTRRLRQIGRDMLYTRDRKRPPEPMSEADRAYLRDLFLPQIEWVEEYLQRDLTAWKEY
jgi:hypothetical protein